MNFEYMVAFLMGNRLQAEAIAAAMRGNLNVVGIQEYSTKPVEN